MEIEIVTTKKKLTKSIINQMHFPQRVHMERGEVLGHLIGVKAGCRKSILIRYDYRYYILTTGWQKCNLAVRRCVGKKRERISFDHTSLCDMWWAAYQRALKEATEQIYV